MTRHKLLFYAFLFTYLLVALSDVPSVQGQGIKDASKPSLLEIGKPVERELAGGQSHLYLLTLSKGKYLNVKVEQRGVDVLVTLLGPNDVKLIEVDSPNGTDGPEPLVWIVETEGQYKIEIRSLEPDAKPGRYEAAIVELRDATDKDREVIEAENLYNEAVSLQEKGRYDEAIPLAERSISLREKALGPQHPATADSLNRLGLIHHAKAGYKEAEPLYSKALAIRERILGAEHPDTATSLNNLASLYDNMGDYARAEPLYLRALAIREKTLGAEHIETGNSLNNLAYFYQAKGDYAQAERLYQRAIPIYEKVRGPEHAQTGTAVNNLALLYLEKGDYSQAEPLFIRALAIREKALGGNHPDTAISLNNLAELYRSRGEYFRSEPLFLRALEIMEKSLGPNNTFLAYIANNLASLYVAKGDYIQAEPLYQRTVAITEKNLGPEHPRTASSINNLGALYRIKGDYERAESLFRRALSIDEKVLGREHPDTAACLNNLAYLFQVMGDYEKAAPLLRRALNIYEIVLGKEHPETASSLNNLGLLDQAKGEYGQAEQSFLRALAIDEKILGPKHPATAISLNNLARLYETIGDFPQAIAFRSRAQAIEEQNIMSNLIVGSERQKLAYLTMESLVGGANHSVALHIRSAPRNAEARDLALTAILQRKGRVLDAMNNNIDALRRRASPADRVLFDQLKDLRARFSSIVLKGPGTSSPNEYQQTIKQLEGRIEQLETEVAKRSSEFRAQAQPISLAGVQSALTQDAVLVEFFSYRYSGLKPGKSEDQSRYVAYVLRREGEAAWVELGDSKAIDAAVGEFRKVLQSPRRSDFVRHARRVGRLVMQPLYPLIGRARRVFISPDGMLNLIPFAALLDNNNHYLAHRYSFNYLTSGRDLLRLRYRNKGTSAAIIVANPDFGERPANRKETARTGLLDLSQAYFSPLKATAEEAKALTNLLPEATILVGPQATETALKQVTSPSILHIATHGFFLADHPVEDTIAEQRRKLLQQTGTVPLSAEFANPLLRSGLGLAGANLRKSGPNQEDDGILTALEVAGLDLSGTKLVVLSACETGVGEVRTGEGVYGLRRALVLAGAETQVMSLWPVSDRATRDLMIGYYKRLQAGEGRSEALRQVQLQMLKDPRRRHPFYWASFIVSGEWASLEGKK